jgi:phenylacetate-CoA ligase
MSIIHERFLDAFRLSQFARAEQLKTYQLALIERLVRHAHENVPYYRERLACALSGDRFRPEGLREIPVITRVEVQEHARELRARTVPTEAGRTVEGSTSGSSGSPLAFLRSHLAIIASECQKERMLEVHNIDRSAHQARIRIERLATYPEGQESTGWNLKCPTSRLSKLHVGTPIAEQVEWLLRRTPKYLMTYPSNAAALAQQLGSIGASLGLSGVLTVGEQVTADQRDLIRRRFGCRVFDSYGATEVGYLAFECPAGGGYHLAHETALIEVIGKDGMTAPAGTLGQVVITCLYNYAMPFIRYAIGDYAVAAEGACNCGRTLPRIASIAGRVRNVFTFTDGSQKSPWGWRSAFTGLISARQMQIVQTAIDTIDIRYVPQDQAPPPDAVLINEAGRRCIHPTVSIRAVAVNEIPRSPSGKIEDCISFVTPSLPVLDKGRDYRF